KRQNLAPEQYTLVPKLPLSCEFYGLILPETDSQWRNLVNSFLETQRSQTIQQNWFANIMPYESLNLEYCFDLKDD
ncbi:MAG TPA: hypothetical protein ACFCUY_04930, partial [Xenococcaceae cyanobacterium]